MERTLSIIKPDGVQRGLIGEVIQHLEKNGLKIIAAKMIHMTGREAEGFYDVHREKPFFSSLTAFMTSGPCVVMVLEGENAISRYRDLMGATNYKGRTPWKPRSLKSATSSVNWKSSFDSAKRGFQSYHRCS